MLKKQLVEFVRSKKRGVLYFIGSIAGLFVLLNYVLLPAYVNQGGTLNVPSVVGLPFERARAVLDSIGLQPVQADTRSDPKQPVGTVVAQNPQQDALVKHGRRVYLSVSGGEALVVVPPLRGRSLRDARFTLECNGLILGEVTYAASETYPENTIVDQSAQPGTRMPKGSSVGITVSRGKATPEVIVPQLVGKTVIEAQRVLGKAGLRLGNVTYQISYDLLPNTVVDQFPRSGESVPDSQAVDLFVVKAGKPKE
jgi:serine/threonine-protein kinase